jgi:hypothetical protein
MANIYSRRLAYAPLKEATLMGGIVPVAPLNRLAMLSDYINPGERLVACPNQDVVYGLATLALDLEPVVVQVPDFGERFWVIQAVNLRTDSFVELGSPYGTKPGFYLLAGPDWRGKPPKGIVKVFRSDSNTGMLIPRIFQNDSPEDNKAVRALIAGLDVYPLSEFTGGVKTRDWSAVSGAPDASASSGGNEGETRWVDPDAFFEILPALLEDARPLPGEEARYAQMRWLSSLAASDPAMRAVLRDEARKADKELVAPLLQLRTFGRVLPHHWGTIENGAAFGLDYFTRTAVARSNIFVNKAVETKYFYQDLDENGERLTGARRYTVTFPPGGVPVRGFWSLTLYNEHHFFVPNPLHRYSIGTKSQGLVVNVDGSLTVYVQPDPPEPGKEANWLPAPSDADFSLYIRAYWPDEGVLDGSWNPPPVTVRR